jgi:hypothetical protein
MKLLPSDPNAFRAHVITALCDDIEGGRGFVRVEAIRAVMGVARDAGRSAGAAPPSPSVSAVPAAPANARGGE